MAEVHAILDEMVAACAALISGSVAPTEEADVEEVDVEEVDVEEVDLAEADAWWPAVDLVDPWAAPEEGNFPSDLEDPEAWDPETDADAGFLIDGEFASGNGYLGDVDLAGTDLAPPEPDLKLGGEDPAAGAEAEFGTDEERALAQEVAEKFGLPVVDLRLITPDPDVVKLLAESMARDLCAIPIRRSDTGVEVAVADPREGQVEESLTTAIGEAVDLVIATSSDILLAIGNSYRVLAEVGHWVEKFESIEAERRPEEFTLDDEPDEGPIVQVVQLMITQALRDRASDVHLEPQDDCLRVRFRIDGALHDVLSLPPTMSSAIVSRIKVMAKMNIVDRRRGQDGQMTTEADGKPVDIRVSTTPTIWGEKAVLRLLERDRTLYRLDELDMPTDVHATFSRLVRSPFGMVICAGPTGAGKTTTLYATLTEINDTERNIMTVEDPVEYTFRSINQIQINEQAGLTFAKGLRTILRQDPDIVLVGEIRDPETGRIAVESALTGHLVLSSMHATDSCSALQRLIDMGIEPFLVASTVIGIVTQRLVRRICSQCRVPYVPTDEELAFYEESGGPPKATFFHGVGCNFCAGTGFAERNGVFELLRITDDIKRLIVDKAPLEELREAAVAGGTRPLLAEGIRLIAEDRTTIAEIIRTLYTV